MSAIVAKRLLRRCLSSALMVFLLLLSFAVRGLGHAGQDETNEKLPPIENSKQLVGKKINVKRLPLCEPGTYKADLEHAGMKATVLSARPSTIPTLSESVLDKMSPEMREMMLDQQKAALLLLEFEDGTKRDRYL